jgi:membrane AbrB-like protein
LLSSGPIGPVETANLAERHGVPAGPVVFAQTLRIVLLVVLIPPAMLWLDGTVSDPSAALRAIPWTPFGATLLVAVGLAGGVLAQVLRVSNPYFLGPLAGSALAAALSMPISGLPYPVLAGAQLFLGVFLGASFNREFLQRSRRFIPVALLSTLLLIALCAALGMGLSLWTGEGWQIMVLSTAPGSVTEMALTAKVLQQGIAVVTAFHVVRLMIMMPLVPFIIGAAVKVARRYRIGPQLPPQD